MIGIAAAREQARWGAWDARAQVVPELYVAAVQASEAIALLLPVDVRAPVEPLLDRIDGLLLMGGVDVGPASYGAQPQPETQEPDAERDAFEIALLGAALDRSTPVLAICRGMQLLNVALGGTLRQHLPEPSEHRRTLGSFVDTENEIALEPGSLAARATGETRHVGHCHHHQAVDRVGDGLTVSGRALVDGLPEAIEAADGRWALGVQWHPEASRRRELFRAFAAAATARARA